MSKILAVFGATGQQGGSVVDYVLNDPHLSQVYKIRGITRDVNSNNAKQLKEKIKVVQGDAHDRASVQAALTGVHTVFAIAAPSFAMTVASSGSNAFNGEYSSAKTIGDVAVEKGAEYIIFSTLPAINNISSGKYTKVTSFDAKAKAEQYIRGLPIRSAFYSMGGYMQSFQAQAFNAPRQTPDGTWVMARSFSPKIQYPLVDVTGDTGKFVGAILAEPDKYEGKTFHAATRLYSSEEIVAILSKATGETFIYKQISSDDFVKSLPPGLERWIEFFSFVEEFGYFGPDTENLVSWAAANARGNLSTLEEFFKTHPFQLK